MTSVSAGHIILTPTQPVGSARPQQGSNPGPPHQESRALLTELPRPLKEGKKEEEEEEEEEIFLLRRESNEYRYAIHNLKRVLQTHFRSVESSRWKF